MIQEFVWANARKDIRRRLRDPTSIAIAMALPALLITLLIPLFGRAPKLDESARVLIAGRASASALVGLLEKEPMSSFLDVTDSEEAAGRASVERGDADALFVFSSGSPAVLELVVDQRPLSRARLAERAARVLVEAARRLDLGVGADELALQLAADSVAIETSFGEWAREGGSGFTRLCFPSFLFLAIFLLAQGLSDDLWRERNEGTLLRARSAPGGIHVLIAGKLVAGALLFAALTALNLVVASVLIGVEVARLPLTILLCALCGTTLLALFFALQVCARSARAGAIATSLITLPLMMIGGGILPPEFLPPSLGKIGSLTPNGWALGELRTVLYGEVEVGSFALVCALLVGTLVVTGAWLVQRVRTRFGVPR